MRSQSAMEYLMTYGWAILIIAVVLGAFYSLGLFNAAALAPRAQPGGCQVIRPNGPRSTAFISLAGLCQGQLPRYVLQATGGSPGSFYFNVSPSTIPTVTTTTGAFTITEWAYDNNPLAGGDFWGINYPNPPYFDLPIDVNGCSLGTSYVLPYWHLIGGVYQDACVPPSVFPAKRWVFIAVSMNSTAIRGFVGVSSTLYNSSSGATHTGNSLTPNSLSFVEYTNPGFISNIQIYNTTMTANDLYALYQEGIGGAPIKIQNLTAWLPLNGNLNDYSGNLYNGAPYGAGGTTANIIYTNQWTGGYTAP